MGFPASDVRRIGRDRGASDGTDRFTVDCTFMGLYGVSTPLPLHYAVDVLRAVESATDETRRADGASQRPDESPDGSPVRDFLDVFHHRLLSLFYRARAKYRYHLSFVLPQRDRLTPFLKLLIGCAEGWQKEQIGVEPIRLIRYAGLLTQHPLSAAGLEGILNDYWPDVEVSVGQFVGRWVALEPHDWNRLGRRNCRLGGDLIVGEQVFDRSGAFDIVVGPMDWPTYCSFLPISNRFAETVSLTRYACSDPLAFRITLRLAERQVPEARLASDDSAARLGYTCWLRTDEVPATQVVFEGMN